MAKIQLQDFLKRYNTPVAIGFRVIEEQPNGHSWVICDHAKLWDILNGMEYLHHRIVSGWNCNNVSNPCGNGYFEVCVYPEGVTNEKELMLFYIKKYLKKIAEGTVNVDGQKVHCSAYFQGNIGLGNIWFIYCKKGNKKERAVPYCSNDTKALDLMNQLKKEKPENG